MLKKEKVAFYKEFKEEFKGKDFIVFDYRGVTVKDLTEVRSKIRKEGGKLKVIKNTLLKRYLKEEGHDFDDSFYSGMNALASVGETFTTIGKIIYDVEKEGKVSIRAGLYEQKEVDADFVRTIAKIPSRTDLYSHLVGGLQGVVSNFVYVLTSIAEQKNQ